MGKINKINTYAVLWLNSQSLGIDDIVKETSLTKKQILSIIQKESPQITSTSENTIETTSNQVSAIKPKMKDLMITESVGRRQNVTIMTKSASEVADEARKSMPINSTSKPYIFKQQ